MYINGPKILNMWLGESERQVREIFSTAREKAKEGYLVFIFIDEAESILRTRLVGPVHQHLQHRRAAVLRRDGRPGVPGERGGHADLQPPGLH